MLIQGQINPRALLDQHLIERLEELQADWEDEAAEASVGGLPQRGFYLHHMSERMLVLVTRDEEGRMVINHDPPSEPPLLPRLASDPPWPLSLYATPPEAQV